MALYSRERLDEIRTRFVRDRLAETTFENHEGIAELAHWEGICASGVPHGWGGHMFYGSVERAHPVETASTRRELVEGIYTSPEEYRTLLKRRGAAEQQDQRAAEKLRAANEQAHRDHWRSAGGRP